MRQGRESTNKTAKGTKGGRKTRCRAALCFLAAMLALSAAACGVQTDPPAVTGTLAPAETAGQSTAQAATEAPATSVSSDLPQRTEMIEFSTPVPENEQAAKFIDAVAQPDAVIMSAEEIAADNARMLAECSALCDINAVPETLTGEELTALITASNGPSLPKYDSDGAEITPDELDAILALRNAGAVAENNPVRLGVCVERANLRSIPSERSFYDTPDYKLDRLQETEIFAGMPLWVLHTSSDGAWLYVRSYFYGGWIQSRSVALTEDRTLWDSFAKPENYAVITEPLAKIGSVYVDMGVKLPLDPEADGSEGTLPVLMPEKDADGKLTVSRVNVPDTLCRKGFLPYTYRNFITQAFKYEGTPYGWGGLDNGVDCSSYVAAVFRVFGFEFPRNTGEQRRTVGSYTDVSSLTTAEKEEILKTAGASAPVAVYLSKHVMLYLGTVNGELMFIHSPTVGKTVSVTARTLEEIIAVCRIGAPEQGTEK